MSSTLDNDTFAAIGAAVKGHTRFAVLSHVRPDGDAIGSQLGLAHTLQEMGKEVWVMNEDGVPESLRFLPGAEWVRRPDGSAIHAEVIFALDTATKARLGEQSLESVSGASLWINVDHHITNPRYGDLNHIDSSASATAQILFELIDSQKWPLPVESAVNLYAGISTDTGSFQYPATTARTYEIGAALLRCGVQVGKVSQQLYESYPYRRIELIRELLNALRLTGDNRVASWRLTQEQVKRLELQPDDSEGLIDLIRAIDSVVAAVFFEELPNGKIRVSARSKSSQVDMGTICSHFGGGGHTLAAGARMRGPIEEAEAKFLDQVYEALSRID